MLETKYDFLNEKRVKFSKSYSIVDEKNHSSTRALKQLNL